MDGALVIEFSGPPGAGKTTALQAVELLLKDAGARVERACKRRACEDGEWNVLVARLDHSALREVRAWMADEPS